MTKFVNFQNFAFLSPESGSRRFAAPSPHPKPIGFPWVRLVAAIAILAAFAICSRAQVQVALAPIPKLQFLDASGRPLAGGLVYFYNPGTFVAGPIYSDSTGTTQISNPVVLDSGGMAQVWLAAQLYDVEVHDASNALQYKIQNVSNQGLITLTKAVLLNPAGGIEQDVTGIVGAPSFHGTSPHTTSIGVRVAILDPTTVLDAATNPPNLLTMSPAIASQNYRIPDPGGHANFVLSPDPNQSGLNVLDCTAAGITCKRNAFVWFAAAGCNNATAGAGWDNFGTNAPTPKCVTGSNIQKGVLAFPAAVSYEQTCSGTTSANTTVTCQYPAATSTNSLLIAVIGVDTSRTVSGCTDGTNAYSKQFSQVNGALDLEVWASDTNTGVAASTTLTCTVSAAGNIAMQWFQYTGTKQPAGDVSATNTGSTAGVTTGTTAGTAQNTELVFSAVAAVGNPSIAFQAGTTGHTAVSQGANVTVASEGFIAQSTATQSGSFTLGGAATWAAGVRTFKSAANSAVIAQRTFALPPTFAGSSSLLTPSVKWMAPNLPTGTSNVVFGYQTACVADGVTDDPAFPAGSTSTVAVPQSSANLVTTTSPAAFAASGCAASNLFHYQLSRQRYNAADNYEGYVYVLGAGLQFAVTN